MAGNGSELKVSSMVMTGIQPKSLVGLVVAGIALYAVYGIIKIVAFTVRTRRRYHDIPSLPRHRVLGNLIQMGEKLNPAAERHPDYGIEEIWEELGCPPAFMMDIAPVDTSILVICEPGVAEQVVQPTPLNKYSAIKSDTVAALWRLTGTESMLTAEGEVWRNLRKRFNKGFSPAHLHSLSPLVVSKTRIFADRLKRLAKSGEVFALKEPSQDLATDVITTIAIEKDFESQSVPEGQGPKSRFGFLTASRILSTLTYKVGQGFNLMHWLDPVRPTKAWFYERIQNNILDDLIRDSLKADRQLTDKSEKKTSGSGKAIVQLALQGVTPTPSLIKNTRDQLKTFLFAGQDTTATSIQWVAYELSKASHSPRHASFLKKLQAEHDALFGAENPWTAFDVLEDPSKADQILGDKLPYTTAFIKEILRVHPPAATARMCLDEPLAPPTKLDISANGDGQDMVLVNGLRLYPSHWIMHRNPKVWGDDAREFNPDRWMDEEYVKKLPVGAWRPFERGPRNCIGQELAVMELKVVLCAVARGLEFVKAGLGEGGKEEVFTTHQVTAVPVDGMRMRVKVR